MNYKEVLKCLKMPNYVSNDFYSMLFARSIGEAAGYGELTDVPPLTFVANGENLLDYRIYGANDGVGEQTENLFDIDRERSNVFTLDASKYIYGARADKSDTTYPADIQLLSYIENQFTVLSTGGGGIGFIVEVKPNTTYTLQYLCNISVPVPEERTTAVLNRVREDGTLGEFWGVYGKNFNSTFETYSDTKYIYIVFRTINYRATYSQIMLVEGSTAPAQYIPFGYQINAEVGDSVTTTDIPIYIGDTPLAQGEYVDYGEQKVYKYVGGVLTPTDPSVALPALPTIDGATIVDFDNTPKPSEVYVKYPK